MESTRSSFPSPFEPVERVGSGAFAEVWRARRPGDQGDYAIKIIGDADANAVDELERTRGLAHPHLSVPMGWGRCPDGRLYVVSPFVLGETLGRLLLDRGKLPTAEACALLAQVLDALSYAHLHGVLHRDVKPENIIVGGRAGKREAVLLDFGLGAYWDQRRVDEAGSFAGTLRYAAPEQVRGENVGPSADFYSWGLVLLECLVGSAVLDRKGVRALSGDRADRNRILRSVTERGLRWAIRRVTARNPAERDVPIEDLFRALDDPSWMPQAERELERRPLTFVICRRPSGAGASLDGQAVTALIRGVAEANGGHCAGGSGDFESIVFGLESIQEDDGVRAARVALDLIGRGVVEVAAIDVGAVEVEVEGRLDDQLGGVCHSELAQAAMNLLGYAAPGQILASESALARLADRCDVERASSLPAAVVLKRLRQGSATVASFDETRFVGREEEIGAIERLWSSVGDRPRAALFSGEPGIGKSRLVREICSRLAASEEISLLRARCFPETQGTPLAAIADMLATFGAGLFDLLRKYDLNPAQTAPGLARMAGLALPDWISPARQTPERERLMVSDALVGLVRGLAAERPLLVVVEDLHWADAQTEEYLEKLMGSGELAGRLLLLLTARATYDPRWLATRGEILALGPLEDAEVAALLGDELPEELRRRIVEQAEGVPLFAAEVGRMIAASGDAASAAPTVPVGLQALVAERLAALSDAARLAVHLASALGREFDWRIVAAAAGDGADAGALPDLVRAGIVSVTSENGSAVEFRHALIRDAVYDSMPVGRRRELHHSIASCLVREFPDIVVKRPELVAQQLEAAGEVVESAGYWKLAGEKNLRQAAYRESESNAVRGLRLVEGMPLDERTGPVQIELLTVIATSQFMVGGYARPEVGETLSRAMVVAEELGESTPLPVLNGLWTYHLSRSHRPETQQMIGIFEKIADSADVVIALEGCAVVGVDAWYAGDFQKAVPFLERAIEHYHRPEFREYADNYGYNGGIYAYPYAMTAHFFLGNKAEADRLHDGMRRAAVEAGDPYSLSISNVFSSLYLVECGDAERALSIAERQIALSLEQQLPLYMAGATCCKGVAERLLGNAEQGLATLQFGMAMYKGMGIDSAYANYLTHLVTTMLELRLLDEADAAIREGLEHCSTGHCRFHEPEFHRLRGELSSLRGEDEAAEAALRLSLAKARAKGNIPFQLRTGAALLGHLSRAGRRDEAGQLFHDLAAVGRAMDTGDWRRLVAIRESSIG